MKACVLTDWEKLELLEVPRPSPGEGQVLVKVRYAGVCGSDINVFYHRHPTATVPRIMSHEIFGTVEEINAVGTVPYAVGDRVVVFPLTWCGHCEACEEGAFHVCRELGIMGLHLDGGFAEYVCADAVNVFRVPDEMPDEVAELTEPFAVGFHAHMRAGTRPGDKVLISGGGPIGLLAAIGADYFGAAQVIVSEPNAERAEYVRSFGFTVVDPVRQNLLEEAGRVTGGRGFDKVFEASGSKAAWENITDICRIRGTIVPVGIPAGLAGFKAIQLIFKEITMLGCRVYSRNHFERTLGMLRDLYTDGMYDLTCVVDRIMPLEQLPEAIAYQKDGKNKGKILMRV